jgi:hypothetical protein
MTPIKGRNNNLIGYRKQVSEKVTYIYNKNMSALGYYDADRNMTLNIRQELVGHGDLLSMLLND